MKSPQPNISTQCLNLDRESRAGMMPCLTLRRVFRAMLAVSTVIERPWRKKRGNYYSMIAI
jgi:hypothetical protein